MHIADVHLGAEPDAGRAYSASRGREIWDSLARVVKACNKEKADLLLIAGDLFHRQPLLRELKELRDLFGTLKATQVVLIAGNHDYLKRDSYYRTFVWGENVHMILGGQISAVELPKLSAAVYGLSYYGREITERLYDQELPKKRQKYEILLAHGGDERHIPIRKEKLNALGYDYIALGHIHRPQDMDNGNAPQKGGNGFLGGQTVESRMAYSGALEPIDKNDIGCHGYILGEMTKERCRIRFVPCALREYVHLDVAVGKKMTNRGLKACIREQIEAAGTQNIYKVTVKGFHDPDILFDLTDMDTYGNIIELLDESKPEYDFQKLLAQNRGDLLGKYIESLMDYDEDSVEYLALCEGVQALMETRRG
ncbi:metallophosphoesterase [Lachnospiraceae bacterium 48-21]